MVVQACDGQIVARAGEGGLMGDSNEPELFMHNYYEAVAQYLLSTHRNSKALISTSPWGRTNASIGGFVDDLIRIVVPECDDDRALTTAVNHDSKCLTAALDDKK